jgi:hypothetical protein
MQTDFVLWTIGASLASACRSKSSQWSLESKDGNPAKDKPGAPSEGGGTKGKNDSGGNK